MWWLSVYGDDYSLCISRCIPLSYSVSIYPLQWPVSVCLCWDKCFVGPRNLWYHPFTKDKSSKVYYPFSTSPLESLKAILLIILPQTNSVCSACLSDCFHCNRILASVIVILFPPYIQPGPWMPIVPLTPVTNPPGVAPFVPLVDNPSSTLRVMIQLPPLPPPPNLHPLMKVAGRKGRRIHFGYKHLYEFAGANRNELSFKKGERLLVTDYRGNWWRARKENVSEEQEA